MQLIGVVTDRDMACGASPRRRAGDAGQQVMTTDPPSCHPEDDVAAVEQE